MKCPDDSKVHAKIQRMQTLDRTDEKNRVQALCDGLGVTPSYLLMVLKLGTFRPPRERRVLLRKLLKLTDPEVNYHFSGAPDNVKRVAPLIREHDWSKEKSDGYKIR